MTKYKDYKNMNVAFVINGCVHCKVLKSIIDRFNINLPIEKRIRIVNCSRSIELGITEPLIELYDKEIKGYPTLFIGRQRIDGADTKEEYQQFLLTLLEDDLIIKEHNPYKFDKECHFKDTIFGRTPICQ